MSIKSEGKKNLFYFVNTLKEQKKKRVTQTVCLSMKNEKFGNKTKT